MRLLKILIFRFFWKLKKNSKIFNVSEGSLLHFFDILQQTGFSKKTQRVPHLQF